jgi:ABC-type glycerol-3-phosphate transport system substrate-binding protein
MITSSIRSKLSTAAAFEKSKTGFKVEESWVENSTAVDTLSAEFGRGL